MWSAAILAGGRARRLGGQDKSALIVDGVRLLDRQLAALRPLTDRILIVGYRGAAPEPCSVVSDLRPGTGPLAAIVTALYAATTDRVLVLAADMPFLTTAFLDFLARVDPTAEAVVPVSGTRWHPLCAMYRRRAASTLEAALDGGERIVCDAVARLHPILVGADRLAPYDPDGRVLANVNTPEDLELCRAMTGNRTAATETSQTTSR